MIYELNALREMRKSLAEKWVRHHAGDVDSTPGWPSREGSLPCARGVSTEDGPDLWKPALPLWELSRSAGLRWFEGLPPVPAE